MIEIMLELLVKSSLLLMMPILFAQAKTITSADMRSKIAIVVLCSTVLLALSMVIGPDLTIWHTAPNSVLGELPGYIAGPDSRVLAGGSSLVTDDTILNLGLPAFFVVGISVIAMQLVRCWRTHSSVKNLAEVEDAQLTREFEELRKELYPERKIRLCWQHSSPSTFTWGVREPTIGVPEEIVNWSAEKRRAAFVHELAHVARGDCASLLFARLVAALFWWQPLSWLVLVQLKQDIERASDDWALDYGFQPETYAQYLIEIARRNHVAVGHSVPMAAGNTLSGRIGALITTRQRRTPMSRTTKLATWLTGLVLGSLLGTIQVVAGSQTEDRAYFPVFKVTPVYPRQAQEARIEGHVVVEFDIDAYGTTTNVTVVEQVPETGIFANAAIEAVQAFHYLPKLEAGTAVAVQGIRNRLNFTLLAEDPGAEIDAGEDDSSSLAVMSRSTARIQREFVRSIERAAKDAEQSGDGDRFVELAEISVSVHPKMASYLLLRATQLGTRNPGSLHMLKAMTLFHLGDLERSREMFALIALSDTRNGSIGKDWVAYIDRETERRELIHQELLAPKR